MKKLWHKYKDFGIIFLLGFVPALWYGLSFNKFIAGVDAPYPFNPIVIFKNSFYSWIDIDSFGHSVLGNLGIMLSLGLASFLTAVTRSVSFGQELYLCFWFFLPMLTMYFALRHIPPLGQKPYLALFAAILYQFNFFQLEGWLGIWQTRFAIHAALPLVFLFLIDCFEKRRRILSTAVLIGLTIFFLNGGGSPPLYGSLILLILVISVYYVIISLFSKVHKYLHPLKIIFTLVITATVGFILSAFWSLPYLYYVKKLYQVTVTAVGGTTSGLGWTDDISRNASVINLLRMQGLDVLEASSKLDYIRNLSSNPFFVIFSFIFPLLLIFALYKIKDLVVRRYVLLTFLLTLIGLVFTAGSHEPFRNVYILLLKTVPGFPIFRSSAYKFGSLFWFSSSILLAFSLSRIVEMLKNKVSASQKTFTRLPLLLSALIMITILAWNYPFFTNRYFRFDKNLTMLLNVPNYVYDYEKWIESHSNITQRTLLLPELNNSWLTDSFRWGYWSPSTITSTLSRENYLTNDGTLSGREPEMVNRLYALIRNQDQFWVKWASFLNIKNVLLRRDFYFDLNWSLSTSPLFYQKVLSENSAIQKVKSFGDWDFYKNISSYFTPLFYAAKSIDMVQGETSAMEEMLLNATTDRLLMIFPDSLTPKIIRVIRSVLSHDLIQANCVFCQFNELNNAEKALKMPYVSLLPDSTLYFIISIKEQRLLNQFKDLPAQRIDMDLSFANKRLAELEQILNRKSNNDTQLVASVLERYRFVIKDALFQLTKISGKEKNDYEIRILTYLYKQRDFLSNLNTKDVAATSFTDLAQYMLNTFNDLSTKVWISTSDSQKKLLVNIDIPGIYKLIINDKSLMPEKILVDGLKREPNADLFLSSGIHRIQLDYTNFQNQVSSDEGTISGIFTLNYGQKITFFVKEFNNTNTYKIKFDYRILKGQAPDIFVRQEKNADSLGKNISGGSNYLQEDGKWHTYENVFSPTYDAKELYLDFNLTGFDSRESKFEINNYTITKMPTPLVFFLRTFEAKNQNPPNIIFQKINPTYYIAHISKASAPYFLVFGQKFDADWKIHIMPTKKPSGLEAANYFNKEIKELIPKDKFIDKEIMSSLLTNSLPEEYHFEANGFANGWYIDKQGDYDLLVEYWPQRIYYLGLFLSLITVFLSAIILIKYKLKK